MNFGELQTRTAERCGLGSTDATIGTVNTGPLAQMVKAALRRIETAHLPGWDWLKLTTSFALAPGGGIISFTALQLLMGGIPQDIMKVNGVRIAITGGAAFPIERRSRIDADAMYPFSTLQTPQCWWVEGRTLGLAPSPDAAYVATVTVVRSETDLVLAGDVPLMPASYHDAIVDKAAELVYRRLHNIADAQVAASSYNERIREMRAHQRPYTGAGKVRVTSGGFG